MAKDNLYFTNALGEKFYLNDYIHTVIEKGRGGFGAPTFFFNERTVPNEAGARLVGIGTTVREVAIPVMLMHDSYNQLMKLIGRLGSIFDPNLGEGVLTVEKSAHTRNLNCYYKSGLESMIHVGSNAARFTLMLRAFDPLFYAAEAETYTFLEDDSSGEPFFPMLPFTLTDSTIFNQAYINNGGHAPTFPIWDIYGQGAELRIINQTTGKRISLTDYELAEGERVTIDTRRGMKKIYKDGDETDSLFEYRSDNSYFFPLAVGANLIKVEYNEVGANSKVELTYYPAYNNG